MSDTLKERKIYRILTNATSKAWDKIAFWTTAKSVDAADGNNLETKVGAIKGITTSTNTTTKGYAADATVIKTLNDSLKGFTPIVDSTGKITGYKTKAGADTVFPFSNKSFTFTVSYSKYKIDIDVKSYSSLKISRNTVHPYSNLYIDADGGNIYTCLAGTSGSEEKTINISSYNSISIYTNFHTTYYEVQGHVVTIELT